MAKLVCLRLTVRNRWIPQKGRPYTLNHLTVAKDPNATDVVEGLL